MNYLLGGNTSVDRISRLNNFPKMMYLNAHAKQQHSAHPTIIASNLVLKKRSKAKKVNKSALCVKINHNVTRNSMLINIVLKFILAKFIRHVNHIK